MERKGSTVQAIFNRVQSFYREKGIPMGPDAQQVVRNSVELGLTEQEVLDNLTARAKEAPAHLRSGSLVFLKRSNGAWIPATLKSVDINQGYVVEWKEADGSYCHKIVSFVNHGNIKPRNDADAAPPAVPSDKTTRAPAPAQAPAPSASSAPTSSAKEEAAAAAAAKAAREAKEEEACRERKAEKQRQAEEEAAAAAAAAAAAEEEAARKKAEAAKAAAAEADAAAEAAAAAAKEAAEADAAAAAAAAKKADDEAAAAASAAAVAAAKASASSARSRTATPPTVAADLLETSLAEPVFHSPPRRPPKKSGELLLVDGRGCGMVDEMAFVLEEDKVQFGLVQFPIGSGTFQRNKLLLLKWVGAKCGAMKRAKQVQRTGEVQNVIGMTHTSLSITEHAECSLDHVLKEVGSVLVADSGDFTLEKLKEEIQKKVEEARQVQEAAAAAAVTKTLCAMPQVRQTAADMGLSLDVVMRELRKPLGALNWVLFKAGTELDMVNAGSESIDEMHSHVDDKQVMYGLLRLGVGMGHFRRVKWIAITFVGSEVGAVKRGQLLSSKSVMEGLMKPHQITLELQGSDELNLPNLVEKVTPYIVADDIRMSTRGKGAGASARKNKVTLADFQAALAEEKVAAAEFFGEDPALSVANLEEFSAIAADHDLMDTIQKVKANDDPLLWAVFSINPDA